jgi:nucleoside-diphosphate-sugar epimerase
MAQHTLRVFDRRPPGLAELDYVEGDVCDFAAVARAAEGMDALLYMAMGIYLGGSQPYDEHVDALTSSLDANVKGVFLALQAAHYAGVRHAVYTSSMSVYAGRLDQRYFPDEEVTPDAIGAYGFTKRLGEEVCRNVWRQRGMSVNALRLCLPVPEAKWLEETVAGTPTIATTAEDVARAVLAALDFRAGFQAFMISGDYEQKIMNMSKARLLLGWEPLARPVIER